MEYYSEKDPGGLDPHVDGAKLDKGKIQASLLRHFSRALLKVAEVGTFGANKYSRGGWQHVENGPERYDDAKWRHLLEESIEFADVDCPVGHAAQEAWNTLARLELLLRGETKK